LDHNAPQRVVSELHRSVKRQSFWNKLAAWMACAAAVRQVFGTALRIVATHDMTTGCRGGEIQPAGQIEAEGVIRCTAIQKPRL
jgi:hypothetical protein